jgi:hypothetical protein
LVPRERRSQLASQSIALFATLFSSSEETHVFEIGKSLRNAREQQKLEFSDIERSTRIRGKYLRALEEGRFDVLPGTAYVKGFLRTYAEYLGLDGQRFLDEYNAQFPPDEDAQVAPLLRVQRRRRLPEARLVAIPVVAAVALVVWRLSTGGDGGNHHTAFSPTLPRTAVTTTTPPPTTSTRAPAPARAQLAVAARRGPCWLSVRRNSQTGKLLYEGTLEPGQSARFSGRYLWIRLGAPWNVDATLNGRRAQLPTTTSNAIVTPAGLKTYP